MADCCLSLYVVVGCLKFVVVFGCWLVCGLRCRVGCCILLFVAVCLQDDMSRLEVVFAVLCCWVKLVDYCSLSWFVGRCCLLLLLAAHCCCSLFVVAFCGLSVGQQVIVIGVDVVVVVVGGHNNDITVNINDDGDEGTRTTMSTTTRMRPPRPLTTTVGTMKILMDLVSWCLGLRACVCVAQALSS